MNIQEFEKTFKSHFPKLRENRKYNLVEDELGKKLVSKDGDIKIVIHEVDEDVKGISLVTAGVPFLGIKAEEMYMHAADVLFTMTALTQQFIDPYENEDYKKAGTIMKMLGMLDNGVFKRIDKSYQQGDVRFQVIGTARTGIITFNISKRNS